MLMMRVPAVRIMRSRPVQKHAPTPHGTRARFAAIHQLISSFRVRASDPAGARITSISGTPATRRRRGRRQWRVFHKGFAFTASPSPGGPQKGPAALPDLINGCRQCRRHRRAVGNELSYFTTTGISQASPNSPKVCRTN